jgi:nucleotide-binding universal stress UspA family protein
VVDPGLRDEEHRGGTATRVERLPVKINSTDFRVRGGDQVNLTTDTQMIEDTPAQYQTRMRNHAEKTLGAIADAARTAGVACEIVHVEHEHPYQAIIDTADAKGCDLIVMASHGRRAALPRSSSAARRRRC